MPFEFSTDAFSCGIGVFFMQCGLPTAFALHTLSWIERIFSLTERECLAIVWAIYKFRVYFSAIPVTVIITVYSALTKLTTNVN